MIPLLSSSPRLSSSRFLPDGISAELRAEENQKVGFRDLKTKKAQQLSPAVQMTHLQASCSLCRITPGESANEKTLTTLHNTQCYCALPYKCIKVKLALLPRLKSWQLKYLQNTDKLVRAKGFTLY